MTRRSARVFHAFAGLGLLLCAACPVVETLCHSNDCIFLSGHDTETTLALLLVLIELTVASLKFAVTFLPLLFARVAPLCAGQVIGTVAVYLDTFVSGPSPPLALRV